MTTLDMSGQVRHMKMRHGVSISEIYRKTGLSRDARSAEGAGSG